MKSKLPKPWTEILRASAAVTVVAQRPFGFWGYPTSDVEMKAFYPFQRTTDERQLAPYTFAVEFGSYSVTWLALIALSELYQRLPSQTLEEVRRAFQTIPLQEGAYGRPVFLRSGPEIHPNARHTAMALLIRLHFLPEYKPDEWLSTVRWIIKTQEQHGTTLVPKGAWKNKETAESPGNALATASCIAALAIFLTRPDVHRFGLLGSEKDGIEAAIQGGLQGLMTLRQPDSNLWEGNPSPRGDIVDSAYVVELLSSKLAREPLRALSEKNGTNLDEILAMFRAALAAAMIKSGGWPETACGDDASLAATISAAFALQEANDFRIPLDRAERYIIEQILDHNGGARLWSWDWLMLARLANRRAASESSRFSDAERHRIETAPFPSVHHKKRIASYWAYLNLACPHEADSASVFILGRGRPRLRDWTLLYILRPISFFTRNKFRSFKILFYMLLEALRLRYG